MLPHSRSPLSWRPLVAELRAALDPTAAGAPEPSTPATPANPAESREAAAQLTALLSELDPGAADFVETNHAALRPLFDDGTWQEFEKLVQGYAFADAQAQLEQALESFAAHERHFRMTSPRDTRRGAHAQGASDVKDLSESRILIVDDVKTNVDILVEALRDEYKLSVALDGAAALRSVEKNPPDLVLLDIVMPGLDGYEVCRRLRAHEPTREVPVMFLSSLEDVKNKAQGFEVGGNDYLTKPFEMLEVKARVRSLLKAKAYADAVREAMARDLRIAREIQMGILPADLAAATKGTGLDVHAVIEPAREVGGDLYEVLRVSEQSRRRGAGRRVGKGNSSRALHGGRRDRAAHAGEADRGAGRDPAPPQRRARRTESSRHVRHDAVSRVRPGATTRVVCGRRASPAGGALAGPSAAAGLSLVRAPGGAHAVSIRSSVRPLRSSPATPSCCSRTACPKR